MGHLDEAQVDRSPWLGLILSGTSLSLSLSFLTATSDRSQRILILDIYQERDREKEKLLGKAHTGDCDWWMERLYSLSLSLMHTFIICLQCKNSQTNEHSHPPTIPLSFAHPSYSLHTRFQWSAQCVLCVYKQLPYEVIAKVEDTAETIITKIKITQV